jgi:AraC family transcriptional regulator
MARRIAVLVADCLSTVVPMMTDLISPYDVPRWVHGETVSGSDALGWADVIQRSYRLHANDVIIPPVDHFAIMLQCSESIELQRRTGSHWVRDRYAPDDVSLLSIAQESHWRWTGTLEVSHVYLSGRLVTRVAEEIADRSIDAVALHDVLVTCDPLLAGLAKAITIEAASPGMGEKLYVDALATQMAVHLLRRYATFDYTRTEARPRLAGPRLRKLECFVEEHLHDVLSVNQLAAQVGMGAWAFSRAFKEAVGRPVHQYIVGARVQRAQTLLTHTALGLQDIAAQCGFSDQAHMTRLLKSKLGVTPGQLRRRTNHEEEQAHGLA